MTDLLRFELGVAAGDDKDGVRVLPADTMNHLPVFMVCGIRHGAGVDDTYIRFFAPSGTRMSALQKGLAERTALREIQFAA